MYVSLTLFIVWFIENLVQYLPERNESLDKNTIYALKRRSVIPNRASCLLATRLETISKVMFIFCS